MKVIDAKDLLLGRFATRVAKMALLGEEIVIVNCEKAYVSGDKVQVKAKYKQVDDRGIPLKGPFLNKSPDRLVRRAIRGMLPYKQQKGRQAYERVMTYVGVPSQYEEEEKISFEEASVTKLPNLKFVSMKEVSKHLGSNVLGD